MSKSLRILCVVLCLVGLVLVRFRESAFFYDPLLDFFHGDFQSQSLPVVEWWKYILNLVLRYGINMSLSLVILFLVFKDKGVVKFSSIVYSVVFLLLLLLFLLFWNISKDGSYTGLFQVRRFLIQPLLIFILLPAFFYFKKGKH